MRSAHLYYATVLYDVDRERIEDIIWVHHTDHGGVVRVVKCFTGFVFSGSRLDVFP